MRVGHGEPEKMLQAGITHAVAAAELYGLSGWCFFVTCSTSPTKRTQSRSDVSRPMNM